MAEHDIQVAFFEAVRLNTPRYPELALMYAIPNGGHRDVRVAVKLKAEGVKAGVLDVHLPVARGGYIGLWIEFKFGKNKPSPEQQVFMQALVEQGHCVWICYDWPIAWEIVEGYLAGKPPITLRRKDGGSERLSATRITNGGHAQA
jgi:hypothetical protein